MLPGRVLCLALVLALTFLAGVGVSAGEEARRGALAEMQEWKTESWGSHPGHVGHTRHTRLFSLDSGAERYQLRYSYCGDAAHAPHVDTPEGYIGMPGPSAANWYHNGFLSLRVNGKDVGRTKPTLIRRLEDGERASVQILWECDDAQVCATFLMLPGDPVLYVEVAVAPKAALQPLGARLVAYPAAYVQQGDRWAVTPTRAVQQAKRVDLVPEKEWWLVYEERKLTKGAEGATGGCALLFLPEEVAAGTVDVGTYPVITELAGRPGVRRLRLALWDLHDKTNPEAEALVKESAGRTAATLRGLDFTCRYLRPDAWQKERAAIADLLPAAAAQPQVVAAAQALMKEIDAAQARLAGLAAAGQPSEPAVEDRVLENLEKLRPLLWELRFARLFAE